MADFGAIIAQAEIAKAQFAAAESRGYARGIEAAAKACDGKWGNYGTRMAMDIRALLPAPSEGAK